MKFLLESLGMTSQCNLNCSYCDWQKDRNFALSPEQFEKAKAHIEKMGQMMNERYPDISLVQYSGGEPLLYPEILKEVFRVFHDKWIRINTNGTLLTDEIIQMAKDHGKVYIAVSLDGYTITANSPRVKGDQKILDTILSNIEKLVEREVPVMLLCTLNQENIREFPAYVKYLTDKYEDAIEKGMLVMPTHSVTSYSKDNGTPDTEVVEQFGNYIKENVDKYKVLSNIKAHYDNLAYFLVHKERKVACSVYEWSLSMHFRKNDIIDSGKFLSFGCGMRGVHELGYFDINKDEELERLYQKVEEYDINRKLDYYNSSKQVSEYNQLNDNCSGKCFPDWVIFDLIFQGIVSIEEAANWFVLFKDPAIQEKIKKYRSEKEK
nr:radical SAM protein [uncultured Lachnoclostridium sp.]